MNPINSDLTGDLAGFAYGEDLEGTSLRSLGYRLLAPLRPEPWSNEMEALARRLQAAPYPDHWPATDLFCSVLLADGRRVVALARYGLADHTPSQRRGGLELIGVVAPADLDVRSALSIYGWLQQRRAADDDLHSFGGRFSLAEATAVERPTPHADPVPVLPVRLWQEGALLFAASTPADPDHRLRLLEQGAGTSWQWLPLVGPDFPLHTYAQRGPLVAWTPHLAGVALKLDRKSTETPLVRPARAARGWRVATIGLLILLTGLLAANWWSTRTLHQELAALPAPASHETAPAPTARVDRPPPESVSRERFAAALYALLTERGKGHEWDAEKGRLLLRYERLANAHKDLQVNKEEGKIAVAAVSVLAERSAESIIEEVRKALGGKGFSERLIKAACDHVREQLGAARKE